MNKKQRNRTTMHQLIAENTALESENNKLKSILAEVKEFEHAEASAANTNVQPKA